MPNLPAGRRYSDPSNSIPPDDSLPHARMDPEGSAQSPCAGDEMVPGLGYTELLILVILLLFLFWWIFSGW